MMGFLKGDRVKTKRDVSFNDGIKIRKGEKGTVAEVLFVGYEIVFDSKPGDIRELLDHNLEKSYD